LGPHTTFAHGSAARSRFCGRQPRGRTPFAAPGHLPHQTGSPALPPPWTPGRCEARVVMGPGLARSPSSRPGCRPAVDDCALLLQGGVRSARAGVGVPPSSSDAGREQTHVRQRGVCDARGGSETR
jgi:hypothetical protein